MNKRNDRGATAIFVAFVLLLLLGAAAIAVDLARGWNERRQDQTSVDIAAVAGALSFGGTNTAIADQVMASARANLDTTYSDAEWNALWTGPECDESARPGGFIAAPASIGTIECIGLNPSFLWAKLPSQLVDTTFARVLGVDSMSTSAEVIVTLLPDSGAGALPFAIEGNVPPGEMCLETGPSGLSEEPCDGPDTGSFGNIAPSMFGNEALGTSQWCPNNPGSSGFNNVAQAIAMGIDHAIFPFPASAWDPVNWETSGEARKDLCNTTSGWVAEARDGVPVNTVIIDTGNSVKGEVTEGLITGTGFPDGGNARLTRTAASNKRNITLKSTTYGLDNKAIWEYLIPGNGVPGCDPTDFSSLDEIDDKNEAMANCFDNYGSSGPQIFSDSILETPRLGIAPRLWHDDLPTGNSEPRPIKEFEVVYIHGIWIKGSSTAVFYPDDDEPISIGGNPEVIQTTGFLLAPSMVSENVHTALGGLTNDTWQPEIWR